MLNTYVNFRPRTSWGWLFHKCIQIDVESEVGFQGERFDSAASDLRNKLAVPLSVNPYLKLCAPSQRIRHQRVPNDVPTKYRPWIKSYPKRNVSRLREETERTRNKSSVQLKQERWKSSVLYICKKKENSLLRAHLTQSVPFLSKHPRESLEDVTCVPFMNKEIEIHFEDIY